MRFLVEQIIAGSAPSLKEYVIGLEVFDRDSNYDPRLDPIVRVEARRLRLKLRQYYETQGSTDPIRIEMPAKGYTPSFRRVAQAECQVVESRLAPGVSVAVLSFGTNAPGASRFFAEGLTDEIVCLLGATSRVQVVSRSSTLAIARQLDVDYILEGSLRTENSEVRVCVQIVNSDSGFCVWSRAYQQQVTGILEGQKNLAAAIVADTVAFLEKPHLRSRRPPTSPDTSAYALYSQARSYLDSRTDQGINRSLNCFLKLIDSSPQYALAYAGLADAYSLGARYNVFPQHDSWQRARSAALNAVRIDYSLAEAHTALGFVDLHYGRDWSSAEREFCTAILLNPRYAPARQWYAWFLAATGRHELAVNAVKQAVRMDPLSSNANADLAHAYYFSRDYDRALQQCEKTLTLEPEFYRAHQLAGLAYLHKGDLASAVDQLKSAAGLTEGNSRVLVLLAYAYAAAGKAQQARQLFTEFTTAPKWRASAIDFALFFAAIGDFDRVFEWLEKAYVERDAELLWLRIDPIYDRIRHDTRFTQLLQRIGSPPIPRFSELVLLPSATDWESYPQSQALTQ